jgi:hypothetical protein
VDESQSASGDNTQAWPRTSLVPQLVASGFSNSLINKGISSIQYGLIGFGAGVPSDHANSFVLNNSGSGSSKLVGTNTQLAGAMGNLQNHLATSKTPGTPWSMRSRNTPSAPAPRPCARQVRPLVGLVRRDGVKRHPSSRVHDSRPRFPCLSASPSLPSGCEFLKNSGLCQLISAAVRVLYR